MGSQVYGSSFSKSIIYSLLVDPTKGTLSTSPSVQVYFQIFKLSSPSIQDPLGRQINPPSNAWIYWLPEGYFPLILLENVKQLFFKVKTLLLLHRKTSITYTEKQIKNANTKKKRKIQKAKMLSTIECSQYFSWSLEYTETKNPTVSSFIQHKWQNRWTFTSFSRKGRGSLEKFNSNDWKSNQPKNLISFNPNLNVKSSTC